MRWELTGVIRFAWWVIHTPHFIFINQGFSSNVYWKRIVLASLGGSYTIVSISLRIGMLWWEYQDHIHTMVQILTEWYPELHEFIRLIYPLIPKFLASRAPCSRNASPVVDVSYSNLLGWLISAGTPIAASLLWIIRPAVRTSRTSAVGWGTETINRVPESLLRRLSSPAIYRCHWLRIIGKMGSIRARLSARLMDVGGPGTVNFCVPTDCMLSSPLFIDCTLSCVGAWLGLGLDTY